MSEVLSSLYNNCTGDQSIGGSFYMPLPLEMILEVISHLDNYSIMNLLRAWPEIKQYTVFITDHPLQGLFFDIEGIDRRYLRDAPSLDEGEDWDWFDPVIDRQPVQLVELSLFCVVDFTTAIHKPHWELPPGWPFEGKQHQTISNFGNTSFVFLKQTFNHFKVHSLTRILREIEMKLERRSCHWISGWNTHFTATTSFKSFWSNGSPYSLEDDPTRADKTSKLLEMSKSRGYELRNDSSSISSMINVLKMETLRVETSGVVRDLHLPSLVELSLVIRQDRSNPLLKRGEIKGLNIPSIQQLVIHYESILPRVKNINTGKYKASFEIANICALQGGVTAPRYDRQEQQAYEEQLTALMGPNDFKQNEEFDTAIMYRFTSQSFIGVPTGIIRACDFELCHTGFQWQISGADPYASDMSVFPKEGLHVSGPHELSIRVCLPGIKLPKIKCEYLVGVNISFFCPGGQLSDFWRSISIHGAARSMGYTCVYAPKDRRDDEAGTFLGLTDEEWSEILHQFKTVQINGEIRGAIPSEMEDG